MRCWLNADASLAANHRVKTAPAPEMKTAESNHKPNALLTNCQSWPFSILRFLRGNRGVLNIGLRYASVRAGKSPLYPNLRKERLHEPDGGRWDEGSSSLHVHERRVAEVGRNEALSSKGLDGLPRSQTRPVPPSFVRTSISRRDSLMESAASRSVCFRSRQRMPLACSEVGAT